MKRSPSYRNLTRMERRSFWIWKPFCNLFGLLFIIGKKFYPSLLPWGCHNFAFGYLSLQVRDFLSALALRDSPSLFEELRLFRFMFNDIIAEVSFDHMYAAVTTWSSKNVPYIYIEVYFWTESTNFVRKINSIQPFYVVL